MPRKIIGKRRGGDPKDEREHFIKCPACGRWIDMRHLDDVLAHERACDGTPAPPPHCNRA
jgi:hypothetical protein